MGFVFYLFESAARSCTWHFGRGLAQGRRWERLRWAAGAGGRLGRAGGHHSSVLDLGALPAQRRASRDPRWFVGTSRAGTQRRSSVSPEEQSRDSGLPGVTSHLAQRQPGRILLMPPSHRPRSRALHRPHAGHGSGVRPNRVYGPGSPGGEDGCAGARPEAAWHSAQGSNATKERRSLNL